MKADPDLVKLSLAHDDGQAEQQTIVIGARLIEPFAIRDENSEYRAEFKKLMPIAVVASQARSIEANHKPCIPKTDIGDQLLEAVTLDASSSRFAEILIDDLHTLLRPSQTNGAIDQTVLQL